MATKFEILIIDPEQDIYAIPSRASSHKREIYFLALVDILTQYGVKKQAAKVAKTVKYGSKGETYIKDLSARGRL